MSEKGSGWAAKRRRICDGLFREAEAKKRPAVGWARLGGASALGSCVGRLADDSVHYDCAWSRKIVGHIRPEAAACYVAVRARSHIRNLVLLGYFGSARNRYVPEWLDDEIRVGGGIKVLPLSSFQQRCSWANREDLSEKVSNSLLDRQKQLDLFNAYSKELSECSTDKLLDNNDLTGGRENRWTDMSIDEAANFWTSVGSDLPSSDAEQLRRDAPPAEADRHRPQPPTKPQNKQCLDKFGRIAVFPDNKRPFDEWSAASMFVQLEDAVSVAEEFRLAAEEAFYLASVLGVLFVLRDDQSVVGLDELWQLFSQRSSKFVHEYVAYLYYRSRGWVVKRGIKFGVTYLLYKKGPPFYHANAAVQVYEASDSTQPWRQHVSQCRLSLTVSKDLLVCLVGLPPAVHSWRACVGGFRIEELLVQRVLSLGSTTAFSD